MKNKDLTQRRAKRAFRVRNSLSKEKPRLTVVKSNKHIEAQIIDPKQGKTLVGLSTKSKELKEVNLGKKSHEAATFLGSKIAQKALEAGVQEVVFDRGKYKYHGILAAVAEGARESGLSF